MNTDSHYLIGYSHQICEDYALSGNHNGFHYAIISDGCSSSDNVDIGARILAKSAEHVVRTFSRHTSFHRSSLYDVMGDMIISNAQRTARSLGLPDTSLDATLLIAVCSEQTDPVWPTLIYAYGDGVISYYDFDDRLHSVNIEFKSGAPLYLSYRLDADRYKNYVEEFGLDVTITHKWEDEVEEYSPYLTDISFQPIVKSFVSVMSDGINTFHKGMDRVEKVADFMDFKNHQGDFVKRRMNAIKRRCEKAGITYDDDISMATIFIGG